jgi:hypothetical protein
MDHRQDQSRNFKGRLMDMKELILAVAGLLAAIVALVKPQSQSTAQASYEELSKAVYEISTATAKNHDDIVAVRSYLAGINGQPVPTTNYIPIFLPNPTSSASASTVPSIVATIIVSAAPSHSAPPTIGPKGPLVYLRPFDQVKK